MGFSSYGDDPMQVSQERTENAKTDHVRTHRHRRADKIGCETYGEGSYDRIRCIAVHSEKHQKDQQQIGPGMETLEHALLQNSNGKD